MKSQLVLYIIPLLRSSQVIAMIDSCPRIEQFGRKEVTIH